MNETRALPSLVIAALLFASACADPECPPGPAPAGTTSAPASTGSASPGATAPAGSTPASASGAPAVPDPKAQLSFVREGKPVRDVAIGDLLRDIPAESFTAYDPYYNKEKTWRAVPLAAVVKKGFEGQEGLSTQEYVLRARDGYTVPLRGSKVFEAGAYIAFADAEVPGWELIGPQRANPGPFYVVWRNKDQQDLETHPRPWQLAVIEIARFEDLFPHTAPTGEDKASPAFRGYAIFQEQCVHCHAVNREGGRVGPELNVPQSIVEYRPIPQIKAYIKDPLTFRYGTMPAHPFLKDSDLDDLVSYFTAMKTRKFDPAKKDVADKGSSDKGSSDKGSPNKASSGEGPAKK